MTCHLCQLSGNWNRVSLDFSFRFTSRYPCAPLVELRDPRHPSYSLDMEGALAAMVKLGKQARAAGATTAAIPCNTMHLDKDKFEQLTGLEMLDMISACKSKILKRSKEEGRMLRVGIVGTLPTMNSNLYQFEGKECVSVVPSEEVQKEIHQIIQDKIKVVAPYLERTFEEALRRFIEEQEGKLDLIVLGCTDLPSLLCRSGNGEAGETQHNGYVKEVDGVELVDPIESLLDLCGDLLPELSETK